MKKPVLIFSIIQFAFIGVIIIFFAAPFNDNLIIIPYVSAVTLGLISVVLFYFFFAKEINSARRARENHAAESRIKDDEIRRLQSENDRFQSNGLSGYARFGDYESFNRELLILLEAVESLCTLLSPAGESITAIQTDQLPVLTDIGDLLKTTAFISENIQKAFDIADNLSTSAKSAFTVSEKVQKGVTLVTTALQESLKSSRVLFEQSQQISGILSLLAEISSRINILSINASIVSARAGTAGRPFKVVAKEIRKLASETEKSLHQIGEDIKNIKLVINNVVEKINYSVEQTDAETNGLLSVVGSLQGITLGVEVFRAVSKAAKEKSVNQSNDLNLLSRNCSLFNSVIQNIASLKNDLARILEIRNDVASRQESLRLRLHRSDKNEGGTT